MLDNIDVDGLGSLNTTAGWLLGTAIVILVVGLAVGGFVAASGKAQKRSDRSTKGLATMGVSVGGAILLGGIGTAVAWGMDQGTDSLMPTAAQPTEITIEQEGPSFSCEQVTNELNSDGYIDPADDDSALQWARDLVGPEYEDEAPLDDPWHANEVSVKAVSWYPDNAAGGCGEQNETVAECTPVEIEWWSGSGPNKDAGADGRVETDVIEIEGSECSD